MVLSTTLVKLVGIAEQNGTNTIKQQYILFTETIQLRYDT